MIDLTVAGVVDPCGRWLASDGGVSGKEQVGCAGRIAGKPAATGIAGVRNT